VPSRRTRQLRSRRTNDLRGGEDRRPTRRGPASLSSTVGAAAVKTGLHAGSASRGCGFDFGFIVGIDVAPMIVGGTIAAPAIPIGEKADATIVAGRRDHPDAGTLARARPPHPNPVAARSECRRRALRDRPERSMERPHPHAASLRLRPCGSLRAPGGPTALDDARRRRRSSRRLDARRQPPVPETAVPVPETVPKKRRSLPAARSRSSGARRDGAHGTPRDGSARRMACVALRSRGRGAIALPGDRPGRRSLRQVRTRPVHEYLT